MMQELIYGIGLNAIIPIIYLILQHRDRKQQQGRPAQ